MSRRRARAGPPRLLATVYPTLSPTALVPTALVGRSRAPEFPFDQPSLRLTHLGRGAVARALAALGLGPGSRLAMPAYHCGAEVQAAHLAGIEVVFYRVDAELGVDEDDLARIAAGCDAAYLISHFGFAPPPPPAGVPVIEDVAHGLFSSGPGGPLGSSADAAVFCPRKSLGTPDGGAVLIAAGAPPTGRPPARRTLRSVASLIAGRAALSTHAPARRAALGLLERVSRADAAARRGDLTETVIGEWGYSASDLEVAGRGASRLTHRIIRGADPDRIRDRRRRNYALLRDELADLCPERFRTLPPGVCPLYLPVMVDDRAAAMVALLSEGVRAIEIWPVAHPLLDRDRFAELEPARRGLLALPVHQDLEPWHIDVVRAAAVRVLRP